MDDKAFNEALEVQRKMARDARDDKTGRPVIYNTRSIDLASLKVDEGAQGGKIVAMYPAHDAQPVESMEDGKKALPHSTLKAADSLAIPAALLPLPA